MLETNIYIFEGPLSTNFCTFFCLNHNFLALSFYYSGCALVGAFFPQTTNWTQCPSLSNSEESQRGSPTHLGALVYHLGTLFCSAFVAPAVVVNWYPPSFPTPCRHDCLFLPTCRNLHLLNNNLGLRLHLLFIQTLPKPNPAF